MRTTIFLFMLLLCYFLSGFVVINELYYDHPGADTGYEWVEIFNISNYPINLEGWRIQSGGSSFTTVFVFPDTTIQGNEFMLVGESEVDNADFTTALAFQNGGGETDGVRIISPDNSWSDTVLYDEPNTNGLTNDLGETGSSFAPDVPAGCSLARIPNGMDTNSNEDWRMRIIPTPAGFNTPEIDLAVLSAEIVVSEIEIVLFTIIGNMSTEDVDNSAGVVDIYLNNLPLSCIQLESVQGLQQIELEEHFNVNTQGYHLTHVLVNSIYDIDLSNNIRNASLLLGNTPIIINELMIRPLLGLSEWIEIVVNNNVDNLVDNIYVFDLTGSSHSLSAAGLAEGYYVLGDNPEDLNSEYEIPISQIIDTDGFPALNNSGDCVFIADDFGTVFDSIEYSSSAGSNAGVSYERINPQNTQSDWGQCINTTGHTAGYENSIIIPDCNYSLSYIGIEQSETELIHRLKVKNSGMQAAETCEIFIYWHDYFSNLSAGITQFISCSEDESIVSIKSDKPGTGFYGFNYFLDVLEDTLLLDNYAASFFNIDSTPWVINEIMFNPVIGEPEWLEIKRNIDTVVGDELKLFAGTDSCTFCAESEYFLLTNDEEDKDFLLQEYGAELEIYLGLGSLNNDGDFLLLADIYHNQFEEFFYESWWGNNQRGCSIERINPLLEASEENWGQSLTGSSPGNINSIFMENIPENSEFSIHPRVFSPSAGESIVLCCKSTEKINKVRLRVYDMKGRLRRIIADDKLQGMQAEYRWNGHDNRDKIVKAGVYIILFESSDGKKTITRKETVTVSW